MLMYLHIEFVDKYSVVIAGGRIRSNQATSKVEEIQESGRTQCQLPRLPKAIEASPSMFQYKNQIILCGGSSNLEQCWKLTEGSWVPFNQLSYERNAATLIPTPQGPYIFGGRSSRSKDTSEIMKNSQWVQGPSIPDGFIAGCGAMISNDELVLIGGIPKLDRILVLNTTSNVWTNSQISLHEKRAAHACISYNSKILIVGGDAPGNDHPTSTEVIDVHENGRLSIRKARNLNTFRTGHGIGLITLDNVPTVVVFGGYNKQDKYLDSVEIWDDDNETWITSKKLKLNTAKSTFGFASVPTKLLCP